MSRRFTRLSTTVAIATASLIVAVAGCASQRTSEETASLSQDADTQPTLAQATPTNPLDNTAAPPSASEMANPPVVASADMPSTAPAPAVITEPAATDTVSQPMPAQTDTTAVTPAAPVQSTTPAYTPPSDTSSSTSMASTTDTTSSSYSSDQTLAPRRDRH